jgi:4-hydroxy-tetrahydrodipicolinate synthase
MTVFTAILSVSPMYNKPSQEGIYRHFAAIAAVSSKPIILYNVPGRTASNMEPQTVVRLAQDFKNIVAIKEAKGDIVQAMELIGKAPEDFLVISGDDMIALPMTLAGGAGVISVIAQGFPRAFSDMIHLALQRKVDKAYAIHYKIAPAIDHIFEQGNPAGIKAVFAALNLCEPTLRLPLVEVDAVLNAKIKTFVHAF